LQNYLSYEEELAAHETKAAEGWGEDFQCDLFVSVENPLTLEKMLLCVTSAKKVAK
jgi:hypothetical protein